MGIKAKIEVLVLNGKEYDVSEDDSYKNVIDILSQPTCFMCGSGVNLKECNITCDCGCGRDEDKTICQACIDEHLIEEEVYEWDRNQ